MRPVLKIPLLHDDEAAVITTKLMIPAPAGIPIFSKTKTNGLLSGLNRFQATRDMMISRAPIYRINARHGCMIARQDFERTCEINRANGRRRHRDLPRRHAGDRTRGMGRAFDLWPSRPAPLAATISRACRPISTGQTASATPENFGSCLAGCPCYSRSKRRRARRARRALGLWGSSFAR